MQEKKTMLSAKDGTFENFVGTEESRKKYTIREKKNSYLSNSGLSGQSESKFLSRKNKMSGGPRSPSKTCYSIKNDYLSNSGISAHSEFPCYTGKNGTFENFGGTEESQKNRNALKKICHLSKSRLYGHSEFPCYPGKVDIRKSRSHIRRLGPTFVVI